MFTRRNHLCCALVLALAVTAPFTTAEAKKPWAFFTISGADLVQPSAISGHNHIVGGWATYSPYTVHAFVRTPDGQATTIDPPGTVGLAVATGVALDGTIVGYYAKSDGYGHGFIRDPAGNFQDVDIPGSLGTAVRAMNDKGVATGTYGDGSGNSFGFLRRPDGSIVTFAPPGATIIVTKAINDRGQIAGYFSGAGSPGFLRERNGTITVFSVPGAAITIVNSLNDAGEIAGYYQVHEGDTDYHGFLRAPDGTITTFDVSGPGVATAKSTTPLGMNYLGEITGYFIDTSNVAHGFVREADGSYKQLDAPGGVQILPLAIGADGKIVGYSPTQGGFRLNRKGWKGE
jgi:hypothetical protein